MPSVPNSETWGQYWCVGGLANTRKITTGDSPRPNAQSLAYQKATAIMHWISKGWSVLGNDHYPYPTRLLDESNSQNIYWGRILAKYLLIIQKQRDIALLNRDFIDPHWRNKIGFSTHWTVRGWLARLICVFRKITDERSYSMFALMYSWPHTALIIQRLKRCDETTQGATTLWNDLEQSM
jgi:hypothetical protein